MQETNATKTPNLTGVFSAKKKDGTIYFRASLTFRGKHISLGSYDSSAYAHAAYLEGARLINNSAITLVDYNDTGILSFEKWVCLLNFRDNGIYVSNPIYMGKKMFYYYFSPSLILKFDLDDLFFYSSHKIMKRGNHYFVAEYGMQTNIVNRYGIKNYAVLGKDYRFINNDSTDFRRENIEIFNTYQGVSHSAKNGRSYYSVRIHLNGNFLVGNYETETEAAIAYNKAVDILKKNGIDKNFTTNYIDGISPRKYADIYSTVEISDKIKNYFL